MFKVRFPAARSILPDGVRTAFGQRVERRPGAATSVRLLILEPH